MRSQIALGVAAVLAASSVSFAQETKPEEIIVTATALGKSALQIAQPATVLSGDDLRREATGTLGETLAAQPGVSATYFGPASSRPVIRGLGGDRVLMLQNGVSSLDVSALSQDHAVSIEPVLADQIEILKGPASLLYGSGAVGGVVNVSDGRLPTQFSRDANAVAVEVRGDTAADERTAVGRLDLGTNSLRIHVNGYTRETDDVEIPGYALSRAERAEHADEDEEAGVDEHEFARGRLDNSDSDSQGGAFGLGFGNETTSAALSWSRFETNYGIPVPHEHEEEHDEDEDEEHEHEEEADVRVDMVQDRYDLRLQHNLGGDTFQALRLRGTYNEYEHAELEGDEVGTRFEQEAYDLRLNLDHSFGQWRGTVGVQYVEQDFLAVGDEAFVPPSTTTSRSVFLFEERPIGDVTLELGGRLETQVIDPEIIAPDYDETAYNMSAGAIWALDDAHSIAMNLTRSQRHPQAAELYADGPHLAISRYEVGDADLSKETANTVDVTFHRHAERGVHWSVSAFYNDFADYIFGAPTGAELDGLPVYVYGQADARFYGFEGELTLPVGEIEGGQVELRLASDYVRGKLVDGGDLPQIPPLRFGAELHYERDRLHLGLQAYRYDKQDQTAAFERTTDAYTMLDADVSYRFMLTGAGELLAFVRGTNLLDEEARRHTSPLKEFAPLPGRSLTLGLRASF